MPTKPPAAPAAFDLKAWLAALKGHAELLVRQGFDFADALSQIADEKELRAFGIPHYHAKLLFKQSRSFAKPTRFDIPDDDSMEVPLKQLLGVEMAQHFEALAHMGATNAVVLKNLGEEDLKEIMPVGHRRVLLVRIGPPPFELKAWLGPELAACAAPLIKHG